MDIPAPKHLKSDELPENEPSQVNERTTVDAEKQTDIGQKKEDPQKEALQKAEVIAQLIRSKKYNLPIKERRSKPFVTFMSLSPKRSKKRKSKKNLKKSSSKAPQSKSKKFIEIAVIIVIWAGLYVAIDSGVLDIGWKPPFSLFNREKVTDVTGTVEVQGQ